LKETSTDYSSKSGVESMDESRIKHIIVWGCLTLRIKSEHYDQLNDKAFVFLQWFTPLFLWLYTIFGYLKILDMTGFFLRKGVLEKFEDYALDTGAAWVEQYRKQNDKKPGNLEVHLNVLQDQWLPESCTSDHEFMEHIKEIYKSFQKIYDYMLRFYLEKNHRHEDRLVLRESGSLPDMLSVDGGPIEFLKAFYNLVINIVKPALNSTTQARMQHFRSKSVYRDVRERQRMSGGRKRTRRRSGQRSEAHSSIVVPLDTSTLRTAFI